MHGITTKSGDRGYTRLRHGRRVRKDDMRIEACGALDELNSFLGLAKVSIRRKWVKGLIQSCQEDLFIVGAELASLPLDAKRLKHRVDDDMIERLEGALRHVEEKFARRGGTDPTSAAFIVPGDTKTSALLDICRSIARRAERGVIRIRRRISVPQEILVYLNRLSDILYLLARYEDKPHKR